LRDVVAELGRSGDTAQGVLRIARYPLRGESSGGVAYIWCVRNVTQQKLADQMRNQFVAVVGHTCAIHSTEGPKN
jgi:hypothetical protein